MQDIGLNDLWTSFQPIWTYDLISAICSQRFTCPWMEYPPAPFQHQLCFDCHQHFLACSGFISPLQSFPPLLQDLPLFSHSAAIWPHVSPPEEGCFTFTVQSPSGCCTVHAFVCSLSNISSQKGHSCKNTWNRFQTNLTSLEDLGSSLLTPVQIAKNPRSKRARNEYCSLSGIFFPWCIWYSWSYHQHILGLYVWGLEETEWSQTWWYSKTQIKLLPWYSNTYTCFSQSYSFSRETFVGPK